MRACTRVYVNTITNRACTRLQNYMHDRSGSKEPPFCVPTVELLRAKDDLLSEGGQSLNAIFSDCFCDWFIGRPMPFVGDDVAAKYISKLH